MTDNANFVTDVWSLISDHYANEVDDLTNALARLVDSMSQHGDESIANVRKDIHDTTRCMYDMTNNGAPVDGVLELSKFCKEANQGDYHRLPARLNKDDFVESVENVLDLISDTEDDRITTTSFANQVTDEIAEQYDEDMRDKLMLVLNHASQCVDTIHDIEKQLTSIVNQLTTR